MGNFESRAITTQLAQMVRMMVHSKTGQLTNHVVNLRTGLDGVKRKREVGPGSATSSFFSLDPLMADAVSPGALVHLLQCSNWHAAAGLTGPTARSLVQALFL